MMNVLRQIAISEIPSETMNNNPRSLSKRKKIDALVLSGYVISVFAFVLAFRPGQVLGHTLLFILPGMYLVIRYWRQNYHAFLFSLVAGIATGFPAQIMAELNSVWKYDIPSLGFFQFNGLPMIAIGWYIIWLGFTTSVYSVFFDKHIHPVPVHHRFWRNHYKFILLGLAMLAGTMFLALEYPSVFIIKHSYLIFGSTFFILPTAVIFFLHPHLLRDVLKAAIFLSLFLLVYEIIGLRVDWWTYPGEYIATVKFFGAIIPIEELILWITLGSLWAITAYEEIEVE